MVKYSKYSILLISVLMMNGLSDIFGQYPANYQYTILPAGIIDEIVVASSGEQAMHHINNLAPYTRPRRAGEFPDKLSETMYIMDRLKESGIKVYSLDNVGKTSTWRGIEGTVTEVSPGRSEIADFTDLPETLVEGYGQHKRRHRLLQITSFWVYTL